MIRVLIVLMPLEFSESNGWQAKAFQINYFHLWPVLKSNFAKKKIELQCQLSNSMVILTSSLTSF